MPASNPLNSSSRSERRLTASVGRRAIASASLVLLSAGLGFLLFAPLAHPAPVQAQGGPTATPIPDLIVDGRTVELAGDLRFGQVLLRNRGRIQVRAYSGSEDSGKLVLRAASIVLESGTSINGDARGFRGQALREGEGPGHGEGGSRSIDGGGGA